MNAYAHHRLRALVAGVIGLWVTATACAQTPVLIKELVSRECSIHVGGLQIPEIKEVASREVSLFILNGPAAPYHEVVSREVSVVRPTPEPPPRVTLVVRPSPAGDRVELVWSAYNQWAVGDVTRFDIYLSAHPFTSVAGLEPLVSVPGERNGETLTNLPTFRDHFIAVVAVDALGNFDPAVPSAGAYVISSEVVSREVSLFIGGEPASPYREAVSRELSLAVATPEPPSVIPKITTTGTPSGSAVTLDWSAYNQWAERDVAHFDIYFSDRAITNVAGMTPYASASGEDRSVTLTGLPEFRDHVFAVVPVDALGNANPAVNYAGHYVISQEVVSREVSLFMGGERASPYRELVSREFSVLVPDAGVPAPVTGLLSGFLASTSITPEALDLDWSTYNELLQGDVVRYRIYVSRSFFESVTDLVPIAVVADGMQRLTLTGLLGGDIYHVAVVAEDALGQFSPVVYSRSAQASQSPPQPIGPIILQAPLAQSAAPGEAVHFSVLVAGDAPLLYQWRLNGAVVAGETNATLTIPAVKLSDAGSYTVVVANEVGSVASEPALLTLDGLAELAMVDRFADRLVFTAASFLGVTNNLTAAGEPGEPRHADKAGGKSLWLTWRAPVSGVATFRTTGSSFDTLLAVYVGAAAGELTEIVSDEDRGGFLTSEVRFNAVAGVDYHVAVDGFAGASGQVVLGWNLDFTTPVLPAITGQPADVLARDGQAVTFQVAAGPAGMGYQWSFNGQPLTEAKDATLALPAVTPAQAGTYRVRVTSPGGAYVDSRDALLEVADESAANLGALSAEKLADLFADDPVSRGVASAGLPRRTGFTSVSVGVPGTRFLNLTNSTTEPADPVPCDVIVAASRWLRFRSPEPLKHFALATTNAAFDTVLAVFTNRFAPVTIACNDDVLPGLRNSRVVFAAEPGVDYLVMVAAKGGDAGNCGLAWSAAAGDLVTDPLSLERTGVEDGHFAFRRVVPPGEYRLDRGGSLETFIPFQPVRVRSGLFEFRDPDAADGASRFYRLVPAP